MKIHVGIDAKDREDLVTQLSLARKYLPRGTWLHIDIAAPKFSQFKSYFNISLLKKYSPYFNFEAHLMVPKSKVHLYFKKPLKTAWVHTLAVKNWDSLVAKAKKSKIKTGIAIGVREIFSKSKIPTDASSFLILAVTPGPSGQKFSKKTLKLISFLRKKYPHATIIVDGGITPKIAKQVKSLGARGVISTSFIWKSKNPLATYEIFRKI